MLEPFLVDGSSCSFKKTNPLPVVFDRIVVLSKYTCDVLLLVNIQGHADQLGVEIVAVHPGNRGLVTARTGKHRAQEIRREPRIVALEVPDIERGVQRPKVVRHEEHLPQGSVSPRHDTGSPDLRGVVPPRDPG